MDRRNSSMFPFVREETDESTEEENKEEILEIPEEVGKSMDIEDDGSLYDRARAQQREALEQEQKEKDAPLKIWQKKQAEKDALVKSLKEEVEKAALVKTLNRTRAGSEDYESYFEKFTKDAPISSRSAQEKSLKKEDRARARQRKALEQKEKDALAKTWKTQLPSQIIMNSQSNHQVNKTDGTNSSMFTFVREKSDKSTEDETEEEMLETPEEVGKSEDIEDYGSLCDYFEEHTPEKLLEELEKDVLAMSLDETRAGSEDYDSDSEESTEDASISSCSAQEKSLEKEDRARAQQREALEQEQKEKDALAESLKREQAEKDALAKTLKKEQAEKDSLRVDIKRLIEQQQEGVEKDKEIQRLHFNIEVLQSYIDTKNSTISSLQERLNQVSEHKEDRAKNCQIQGDYEAELDHLTQENQQLASENKRLQAELEAALNEGKQLQVDRESPSRLKEAIEKEKAKFLRVSEKIQMQEEELSEKALALEKSLTAETYLRSCLKKEQKRFQKAFFQKRAGTDPLTILSDQLRDAFLSSECLIYDMQTLRMENVDIRAKFKAVETEYNSMKSKLHSLSEHPEKMTSKKNDAIPENQRSIAKLQCTVDELKALQSESKLREAQLKDDLKREKTKNSELQQRVNQLSSALEKESTKCEKYCSRKTALDESTKSLHHLQKEYTELVRRYCDVNSEYHELLRSHTFLKVGNERLSSGKGNP